MKSSRLSLPLCAFVAASLNIACEDNVSNIGSSLTTGEVSISIDSITYDLKARAVESNDFDSRSGYLMLGNLNAPEYGALNCSFVTRLMPATSINVADSLFSPERVDSCKISFGVARGDITGDSLAPQKLAVYRLDKQLPDGITNTFNPDGYYDPAKPFGTKSFTMSAMAGTDSAFLKTEGIFVDVDLPKEFGKEVFKKYKDNPEIFSWPSTFAKQFLPGLFVKTTFGKGCVASVQRAYITIFYHSKAEKTVVVDGDTTKQAYNKMLSVIPFSIAPEVLSSNNISYVVAESIKQMNRDGKIVLTTPGGFNTEFRFPAEEVIEKYRDKNYNLSMVGNLSLSIPAEEVENSYGISVAPDLLLVKTSELKEFFAKNKLPDNESSFSASYNSTTKTYTFPNLRSYILSLIDKETISEEDVEFSIVPVNITKESNTSNSYYGSTTSYVTKCTPYTIKPTMTRLLTDQALIVFTFSSQIID